MKIDLISNDSRLQLFRKIAAKRTVCHSRQTGVSGRPTGSHCALFDCRSVVPVPDAPAVAVALPVALPVATAVDAVAATCFSHCRVVSATTPMCVVAVAVCLHPSLGDEPRRRRPPRGRYPTPLPVRRLAVPAWIGRE